MKKYARQNVSFVANARTRDKLGDPFLKLSRSSTLHSTTHISTGSPSKVFLTAVLFSCRDEEVLVCGVLTIWENSGCCCDAQHSAERPGLGGFCRDQLSHLSPESNAGLSILRQTYGKHLLSQLQCSQLRRFHFTEVCLCIPLWSLSVVLIFLQRLSYAKEQSDAALRLEGKLKDNMKEQRKQQRAIARGKTIMSFLDFFISSRDLLLSPRYTSEGLLTETMI